MFVALDRLVAYDPLLPALGVGRRSRWPSSWRCRALLILPQSVLLGMTFPLMSAALRARARPRRAGESLAMLYFTNSLGAAVGVLASGFVLIAAVGLPGTLRVAGVLNLAIAARRGCSRAPRRAAPPQIAAPAARRCSAASHLLLAVAFFTGLASFIYEIGWIRMLSLVLGASTHSFELMLSAFILGLALGGSGGAPAHRPAGRAGAARSRWVQIAMGLPRSPRCRCTTRTFTLMEALMQGLARTDAGYALFNLSGARIACAGHAAGRRSAPA